MKSYNWSYPKNDYGQRQGISDSGIETFKGNIEASLAREICQNSLDAALPNQRVRVEFKLFNILKNSFPGYEEFKEAINKAEFSWKNHKDGKVHRFIEGAKKALNEEEIPFLRISDFNTTGLLGSNQPINSDWANLIKSSGTSDKHSTAGGSFGIGKFATYAASALRTVFYSTKDSENIEATQGVARLVSFNVNDTTEELTQGIGFYGIKEKHDRIPKHISLDSEFERNSSGTDIFIAAYIERIDWNIRIIHEILSGFLVAIEKGSLEIVVENDLISKETLNEYVSNNIRVIRSKKPDVLAQYLVLTHPETHWQNVKMIDEDDVRIGILLDIEDASNSKISMIRKPWMKIQDQKGTSSSYLKYSGVFLMQGQNLNSVMRKAENPQHTKWESDRIENDPTQRSLAQDLIRLFKKEITKMIQTLISKGNEAETDIEGASNYIPMIEEGNQNKKTSKSGHIANVLYKTDDKANVSETMSERQEKIETEAFMSATYTEGDEVYINDVHGGGKSKENLPGEFPRGIEDDENEKIKVPQSSGKYQLRLFSPNGNHNELLLVMKNQLNYAHIDIGIKKVDEDGNGIQTKIIEAILNEENLEIKNGRIKNIPLTQGLFKIKIFFDEPIPFSAEVQIYAS